MANRPIHINSYQSKAMANRPKRCRRSTAKVLNNANGSLLDTIIDESPMKPEKTDYYDVNEKRFISSCDAKEWNTIMGSYPAYQVDYIVKVPMTFSYNITRTDLLSVPFRTRT